MQRAVQSARPPKFLFARGATGSVKRYEVDNGPGSAIDPYWNFGPLRRNERRVR
jgi:hypothetical protein